MSLETTLLKQAGKRMRDLQHEYDSTRGLWCIDQNPNDVTHEWIKENAFQLKNEIK